MAAEKEIPILPADGTAPEPEPEQAPARRGPSPRQTLSYLRSLFQAYGLEVKTKLGQNYLIDLNLIDLIVRTAEIGPEDAVLEVGTGTGSLTARLADHAGAVVTIEIDRTFQPIAHAGVAGHQGLQRDERAGAEPGRRGAGAEGAAEQLLPPAEGRFGDRDD
jgi:16S rRNA (adenine1518-N6/adenine1519-N6)-dimethyltransferase